MKTVEPIINFGKLPPQAVDMERDVLGGIMLERTAMDIVSTMLIPESFYKTEHQNIYRAMLDLYRDKQPIDFHTVIERVKFNKDLNDVCTPAYIINLSSSLGSASHIRAHAQHVAEKYMLRELIAMSNEIQTKAYSESEDLSDILHEANSKLIGIQSTITGTEISNMAESVTEAMKFNLSKGKKIHTRTVLDNYLFITDTDYIMIAARPSHGKTAFALQTAVKMSKDCNGLYFSLEMNKIRIVNRILSNEGEIEHDIFFNEISNDDAKRLDVTARQVVEKYNLFIEDSTYDIEKIRAKIMTAILKYKIKFVVIDYLQLIHAAGFGSNDNARVSYISRTLKNMTLEFKIPFFVLSQLNRDIEKGAFRKPKLSDLRDSGSIEQDADSVLFLTNYHKAGQTMDSGGRPIPENLVSLDIAKHRNGKLADNIGIYFEGRFQKFTDSEFNAEYNF
jgi:replicative DNA helicase